MRSLPNWYERVSSSFEFDLCISDQIVKISLCLFDGVFVLLDEVLGLCFKVFLFLFVGCSVHALQKASSTGVGVDTILA